MPSSVEFYYSADANNFKKLLEKEKSKFKDCISIDASFILNNLRAIEALIKNEEQVLKQIELLARSLKTYQSSIKVEKTIISNELFESKFSSWQDQLKRENKVKEFNESNLSKSLSIEFSYDGCINYLNKKRLTEPLPLDLKLKFAISAWHFLRQPSSSSKDNKNIIILDQIECHLSDQDLFCLINLIDEVQKYLPSLNFFIFSHTTKNSLFYEKINQIKQIDIKWFCLNINKWFCLNINEKQTVYKEKISDLKSIENNECDHGYVKNLIIKNLIGKKQQIENENLISNIDWQNVPKFCVITGKNGIGKTTLLKFINRFYDKSSVFLKLEIGDYNQANMNSILNTINPIFIDIKHNIQLYETKKQNESKNEIYDLILNQKSQLRELEKYKNFTDNFLLEKCLYKTYSIENLCINSFIGLLLFVLYWADMDELNDYLNEKRYKYSISIDVKKPVIQIDVQIGPPTTTIPEETRRQASLIDQINLDTNVYFFDKNNKNNNNNVENYLHLNSLSAGEKIILYVYLWEYLISKNYSIIKNVKCLLIDEPDSHLHPIKVKELLEFMQEKLVKEMNYQIFMTTHHPVTASFVDKKNLFLMYLSEREGQMLVKIKNSLDCRIDPVDHLADRLFIISKQSNQVFVESELTKLFLERVYQQTNKMSLRARIDSNFFKMFRNSKLEFLVFQNMNEIEKDSYAESNDLKAYVNEFMRSLGKFKNDLNSVDFKNLKKFRKEYAKKVINCIKHIKNCYFDPIHMDLINKHTQLIETNHDMLDDTSDNEFLEQIKENIQFNVNALNKFIKNFELFESNKEMDKLEKLMRKNLIQSVQYGNNLRPNNLSYSFGYVKKSSYFDTKEFLVYELREVENYLFDPLNIFLIAIKSDVVKEKLNSNDLFNDCLDIYFNRESNKLDQVLNKLQDKIEQFCNLKTNKTFKCEIKYFDEHSEKKESILNYKSYMFSNGKNLLNITHDLFCVKGKECNYKEFKPDKDCIFDLLKIFYEKENSNLNKKANDINQKYSLGLLYLIQEKDIDLLISSELIQRFHYMELFMRYRFEEKPTNSLDEYLNDVEKIENSPLINELINYFESKYNKVFSYNKLTNLFLPDMSFKTQLHKLIQNSQFEKLVKVHEQFDKYKLEENDLEIILAKFFYLESFKEITIYEADTYANLYENVNTADLNKLEDKNLKSKFEEALKYFETILEQIKSNLKNSSVYSYGNLKNITCEDYESD